MQRPVNTDILCPFTGSHQQINSTAWAIRTMGSKRGDEHKKPCLLGEGTGPKGSDDSEAPQRATASRLVPTHQSDPPADDEDKRRYGYSRDHRPDCVQVVIALVVTPEGLPLAYEVLAGNTRDCTTLKDFLARIERQGATLLQEGSGTG